MKRFAFILALIVLASCEIHFELDKASDPVMYVQYLPSSEIDAKIMVAYADPAFDKPAAQADGTTGAPEDRRPAWSRRLELPFRVDADKANAKFTDGILRIELPKTEANGVRHIEIK